MRFTGLLIFCLLSFLSHSQHFTKATDTTKFRIFLPSYWKPGHKAWRILNEKLPLVCEELKDKDLCGDDCNPLYNVILEISEPEVIDYYSNRLYSNNHEFVTLFTFQAAFLLRDNSGNILTRMILADTNEVFRTTRREKLNEYIYSPPPLLSQRRYPGGMSESDILRRVNNPVTNQRPTTYEPTPHSYIRNNKRKLQPTEIDLLEVINKKIELLDR